MKDARGHGSTVGSSHRVDFGRNKIGIAPAAQFSREGARNTDKTGNQYAAALRNRLASPKQGLAHAFMIGVKRAMGYST
jgi:hypothetical protein